GANLNQADLRGCILHQANLWDANLAGACLTGAMMPDGKVHN
ncbi:MAG TPA: pentapeptide repeat-containing protein, partial [Coleofasciculaceae cyanobacterium]